MHDPLFAYIEAHSHTPLSNTDKAILQGLMVYKHYKKKQFLLQEGDVCKSLSFILKGATRQYAIDEKGNEHILSLAIENWWVGDRESYFKGTPSAYNIDAWEDTGVLMVIKADLPRLNAIPAFAEMRVQLDQNYSIATQSRLLGSISYPAEKRYEELLIRYPAFLQRFPQHIIASYLGITKETLSRIRSQSLKK